MRKAIVTILKTSIPAVLLGVFFFLDLTPSSAETPPNIVLILSDDQSWTDYGFMGHEAIRTPHIDKLASESMVYTRGYVPTSLCRPSLATLSTGLYPHQHGITGNDPDGEMMDASNRTRMVNVFNRSKTLAEMLAAKGYVSHQSGKWWEGAYSDGGFTAGMTHGDPARKGRHGDEGLKIGREGMRPVFDFVDAAGDKPFFLWYAPIMPHTPHDPPERILEKYRQDGRPEAVAKYYAMCEWFDETVGELLGYLDEKGLRENTLVFYLEDNGWVQTEDQRNWFEGRAKVSPYDAGLRTPIMIRWPGKVQPGKDERTLASSVDFVPTVLAAAGIDVPKNLPGIDLRDRARLHERKMLFGELFAHTAVDVESPAANLKYRWAVREDGWKLIDPYTPNAEVELMIRPWSVSWMSLERELYNVLDDPAEAADKSTERADVVGQLAKALDQWWAVR